MSPLASRPPSGSSPPRASQRGLPLPLPPLTRKTRKTSPRDTLGQPAGTYYPAGDGYMDAMGADPKAGRLLVATPLLGDPNFRRTVILIVEHEVTEGTLGVVLNRPTQIPVGQVLEQWTDLVT